MDIIKQPDGGERVIHRRQAPLKPIKKWTGPKPPLEMKRLAVFRVNYRDLQAYLKTVFGMEINIMKTLGLTHGMAPVYVVTDAKPSAINYQQQCDNIRRGYPAKNMPMILYTLCVDGFIPQGQYIIDTSKPVSLIEQYRELLGETEDPSHPKCKEFHNQYKLVDREFYQQAKLMNDQFTKEQKRKR